MDTVINTIIALLTLPLLVVMWPLDLLLQNIPGIEAVPSALSTIVGYIGAIPETMVNLLGINPYLWNAIFLLFLAYIGAAPAINLVKKVWAWIRP